MDLMSGKILKKSDISNKLDLGQQVELDDSVGIALERGGGRVIRRDVLKAGDQAKAILEEARVQAVKLKERAKEILARVQEEEDKAREKGHKQGYEDGLAEVSETLVSAKKNQEMIFADLEKKMVRLVYDIAEKVIGRELADKEEAIVDLIRQALHATMGQQIVIFVHPADFEIVKKNEPALMHVLDASRSLVIRSDDKVKPKGCLIETEVGMIDAQLETQLHAIKKALGLESSDEEGETDE